MSDQEQVVEQTTEVPAPLTEEVTVKPRNFTLSHPNIRPLTEAEKKRDLPPIHILGHTRDTFTELLAQYPNFRTVGKQNEAWGRALSSSLANIKEDDMQVAALQREGANWQQFLEVDGSKLGLAKPSLDIPAEGGRKLTGANAIARVTSITGMGSRVSIPCVHSGFWLVLNPAGDSDLAILDMLNERSKYDFGRKTFGIMFSGELFELYNNFLALITRLYHSSNIVGSRIEDVIEYLVDKDINIIAHALSCSIYPNGYPISQPCVADPEKCQHVSKEHVELKKLFWFDNNALLDTQKRIMLKRGGSAKELVTIAEIESYQQEGVFAKDVVTRFEDNDSPEKSVAVVFQVARLKDLILNQQTWISEIEDTVIKTLGEKEVEVSDINLHITNVNKLGKLRQFAHYVKALKFENGDEIEDNAVIQSSLEWLSTNGDFWDVFSKGLKDFINNTTVGLIALENYPCPSCGAPNPLADAKYSNLVAWDPMRVFFTLKGRKLIRRTM